MKRWSLVVAVAVAIGAASWSVAHPASAQPARSAALDEATRHFQRATAATNAQKWDDALVEYDASNRASPSVAAQAGSADAHYHLHHDAEAADAYTKILALNVEVPASQRTQWEAQQQLARTRIAEINDRKNAAAKPAPPPQAAPPPPPKKRRKNADQEDEDGDAEKVVRTAKNVVFAELGGNGIVYSINYERLFDDTGFGVRVGFSYISFGSSASDGVNTSSTKLSYLAVPILVNYYLGSANHKLQLGLGLTISHVSVGVSGNSLTGSADGIVPLVTAAIGYRYMPAKGGFNFSIGFTPFFIPSGDKSFLPWAGLGLGAVF